MRKNKLLLLLALLMTAATGAWAQTETLLTTIVNTGDNASFKSGSKTFDDMVTVTFSKSVENYGDDWGWTSEGPGSLLTVAGINGCTITSCKFYTESGDADTGYTVEGESPSVYIYAGEVYNDDNLSVNIGYPGITKIEVYGTAPVTYKVTMKSGVKDADKWTVKVGEGEAQALPIGGLKGDGSENVTLQYNGRLKVKGVKATSDAAPAAPAFAADEYNEASWDDTNKKVVFEKKKATTTPVAVADANTNVTWDAGWYTVSGNVTITGNVTLTADAHLILQDGATLTINGELNPGNYNLYIYGQSEGTGKLNITNSDDAIFCKNSFEIHGGEITAVSTNSRAIVTGILNVYSGKLTATSDRGNGIQFSSSFGVYGGEVEVTSNETSSESPSRGITSSSGTSNQILTVYGGKVTATGNGKDDYGIYGSGFGCYVKSGTSGIKFYFSADGTTWGDGTSYASATQVGTDAATKKRYAKAE